MTTRFRLNTIALGTDDGDVTHQFSSDLTVLAGPTGVGKTTLLELVKFGLGGNGVLADVAREHVNSVLLDVTIADSRFQIVRRLDSARSNIAHVTDLRTRESLPDHYIERQQPSLNSLLMNSLGLPDDMRAAAQGGGSSRAGARITFSDVFNYMYIPQSTINRDIAHSQESYREPKRRTVFELLFALTDAGILALQSDLNTLNGSIAEAEREYATVLAFLRDSQTTTREEANQAMSKARASQSAAEEELIRLREAMDPVGDRETQALRDLLTEAERSLADTRAIVTDLVRQQADYTAERRRVQTDVGRLQRMQDAGHRLADFEFFVCPRCMQSLSNRDVPDNLCRVCLQPDPVPLVNADAMDQYEVRQLSDQLTEMDDQLYVISDQLTAADQAVVDREQLVQSITEKLDARTLNRISPRLQAFTDVTTRLASAQIQQEQLELVLRQWDRADDLGMTVRELNAKREALRAAIYTSQNELQVRRREVLDSLSEEFQAAAITLGIPGVETASIHPTKYLPMLNGQLFNVFSPAGGGIVTATQVAYWTSLLNVALRDEEAIYPAFLLIDSPRLALNTSENLSAALYRRLVTQAEAQPGRVQLIIADNELPSEYRRNYAEIDFTYENPTISTVHHPGPAAVRTIGNGSDNDLRGDSWPALFF